MKQKKLSVDELLQIDKKQFNVIHKFRSVKDDLDDFLYPFVTAKELRIIGRVLTKIKKHLDEKENESNE